MSNAGRREDCEHGYRAAGGNFDCPACEVDADRPDRAGSRQPLHERKVHFRMPSVESAFPFPPFSGP